MIGRTSSIGTKIFAAFLAMGLIIGMLGAGAYWVASNAGGMVIDTYDGPLMAINYARAASVDFVQMQETLLRRRLAPPSQRSAIDRDLDGTIATFRDDLAVAEQRSTAADERRVLAKIKTLVNQWTAERKAALADGVNPEPDALDAQILDRFDMLIELNADNSFVGRRKAVSAASAFKSSIGGATAFAFLLACLITLLLTRRIMRPLKAAVAAADRIAVGEFQTPIPAASHDETGALLHSMRVMQANIGEMVAREQARAQSAEVRLGDALEHANEGVMLFDADGRMLIVNSMVARFFPSGAGRMTAGSNFGAAMDSIEVQLLPFDRPSLERVLRGDDASAPQSLECQLKDGRWLRLSGSRTTEKGVMVLISDFTPIKQREEDYKIAKIEAEAASAAKSRFVANMSHELRTPLNAIIGFSEVIAREMFGEVPNKRYLDYAADILRSGKHLLDVVNSVLDLAKSEAGKMQLRAEAVDLRFILTDCVKMIRDQCILNELRLSVSPFLQTLPVLGEKAKLRQIFLNILSNAVKFTEPGGAINIGVVSDEAGYVRVEIADTGIGMSAEDIQVAMTPFGQVDNRLERRFEGTGLGLPLTKALVDLHAGELLIESEPGKGTKVILRFARADLDANSGDHDIVVANA